MNDASIPPAVEAAATFLWLAFIALCVLLAVVCWRKGKRKTAVLGFLAFHPALVIGAIRLAKPDSTVGRKYSSAKFALACKRFPEQAEYAHKARPLYVR